MTAETTARPQTSLPWWVVLIEGLAAIIVGILLYTYPRATTTILVQILGLYWLISGVLALIGIFLDREKWGIKLAIGALGILAGILILQNPLISAILIPASLIIVLGLVGLVIGILNIVRAFMGGGWGIGILGVLSILFGLILMGNTMIAAATLPFVAALLGLVLGIFTVIQAVRMWRHTKS